MLCKNSPFIIGSQRKGYRSKLQAASKLNKRRNIPPLTVLQPRLLQRCSAREHSPVAAVPPPGAAGALRCTSHPSPASSVCTSEALLQHPLQLPTKTQRFCLSSCQVLQFNGINLTLVGNIKKGLQTHSPSRG